MGRKLPRVGKKFFISLAPENMPISDTSKLRLGSSIVVYEKDSTDEARVGNVVGVFPNGFCYIDFDGPCSELLILKNRTWFSTENYGLYAIPGQKRK